MRLPRPDKSGLAMTKSGGLDESDNYKNLNVQGGESMAIAEVSVVPLGTKTPSVSQYVARAVRVLEREKGIKYELTAMGTIVEGDLDRILAVVRKMHMKEKVDSLKKKL
jgi:uncharacterized protein (TIGR00106 family)